MKFLKNPWVWFCVWLFGFLVTTFAIINDSQTPLVKVEIDGQKQLVRVEYSRKRISWESSMGSISIYEENGKVMEKETIIPVRKPTIFFTKQASKEEVLLFTRFFPGKT